MKQQSTSHFLVNYKPVAVFIVPDCEDKVYSGIWLSYQPARLHSTQAVEPVGSRDNPMPELTIYPPVRDYEFGLRNAEILRTAKSGKENESRIYC
jgi:hypothetical protein